MHQIMPAAPTTMEPWILQALTNGPMPRAKVLETIKPLASGHGFHCTIAALKKAGSRLKLGGKIYSPRIGWWALSTTNASATANTRSAIRVLREIGGGNEDVYVLQVDDEVAKAKAIGQRGWRCKIGRSRDAANVRLSDKSLMEKGLEYGLVIHCNDAKHVEGAIHAVLKARGRWKQDMPGKEWFNTSPEEVENIYFYTLSP